MPPRRLTALVLTVLTACAVARADEWTHVPLAEDDAVKIVLLVKPVASSADATFIGFEITNKTERPFRVANANYRLDRVRITSLVNGKPLRTQSLASGNHY